MQSLKNVSDDYPMYDDVSLNEEVELIEEQQDINIQALQEKNISYVVCKSDIEDGSLTKILNSFFIENQAYIDSILEALKQLDRKIKEG